MLSGKSGLSSLVCRGQLGCREEVSSASTGFESQTETDFTFSGTQQAHLYSESGLSSLVCRGQLGCREEVSSTSTGFAHLI